MKFIIILKNAIKADTGGRGSLPSRLISVFFGTLKKDIHNIFLSNDSLSAIAQSNEAENLATKKEAGTQVKEIIKKSINESHEQYEANVVDYENYDYSQLIANIIKEIKEQLNKLKYPEGLLYALFNKTIKDLTVSLLIDRIMYEVDEQANTLLSEACKLNDPRVLKALITHGYSDRLYKIPFTQLIALASENGHSEILEYLQNIATEKFNATKAKSHPASTVALMGSIHSPSQRIAITTQDGSSYKGTLPPLIVEMIRPVKSNSILLKEGQRIAETPGGTAMQATWHFVINKDIKAKSITVSIDSEKIYRNPEKPKPTLRQERPKKLPPNTKKEFLTRISKAQLKEWQKKSGFNNKRYRSQKASMGGISAFNVAEAAGYYIENPKSWHYCHLVPYSMGGPDNEYPMSKGEYDLIGPQRECNIVIGTVEANAMMVIVEDVIRKLIYYKGVEEIFINIKPTFVKGLEQYHIASSLEYTIQDKATNPSRQITFNFDMLSRQKLTLPEILTLGTIITDIFICGGKNIPTPKSEIEAPEILRSTTLFNSPCGTIEKTSRDAYRNSMMTWSIETSRMELLKIDSPIVSRALNFSGMKVSKESNNKENKTSKRESEDRNDFQINKTITDLDSAQKKSATLKNI